MLVRVGMLLVLLLAAAPASAQRWTASVGERRESTVSVRLERSRGMGGRSLQAADLGLTLRLRERVTAVAADGTASIEAEVASVVGSVQARMVGMSTPKRVFDTAKPPEGPDHPLKALSAAAGERITFTRSPSGAVSGLRGGTALRDAIQRAGKGQSLTAFWVATLLDKLTAILADPHLEDALNSLLGVLPPGEEARWTRQRRERLPELGALVYTARREAKTEGDATLIHLALEGTPRVEAIDPASGGKGSSGIAVKSAEVSGEARFEGGRLVRSELRRRIDGTAKAGLASLTLLARATLRYEVVGARKPSGKRFF